jgi:RNA polymerase sigma factor (sigma-70 family)
LLSATVVQEFDQGYNKTLARLSRIFRSRGITSVDAEDLAQEAVLRTLTHLDRHGRRPGDLTPLMNTIAKNLVVERFRTGGRELPFEPDDRLVSPAADPADEVARAERSKRVNLAIDELPARQRVAVRMWLEGSGPAEIAQELGLKRNAADALLHRARRFLATKLEDCREGVWSAGAFLAGRVRDGSRRLSLLVGSLDPSTAIAPAVAAMGTVLVATSIFGASPHVAPRPRTSTSRPQTSATRSHPLTARNVRRATRMPSFDAHKRARSNTTPRVVRVSKADGRVDVGKPTYNPFSRQMEQLGVYVDYEPDPNHPGVSGPIIEKAFEVTCTSAPTVCEE